jgi:hypothetical protein
MGVKEEDEKLVYIGRGEGGLKGDLRTSHNGDLRQGLTVLLIFLMNDHGDISPEPVSALRPQPAKQLFWPLLSRRLV